MTNASGLARDGRTAFFPQEPHAILAPAEVTNLAPPEGSSQTITICFLVLWHKLAFAVWKGWSKLLTQDIQRTNMIKGTRPYTDKPWIEGLHPKPDTVKSISDRQLFHSHHLYILINYLGSTCIYTTKYSHRNYSYQWIISNTKHRRKVTDDCISKSVAWDVTSR